MRDLIRFSIIRQKVFVMIGITFVMFSLAQVFNASQSELNQLK